MVRYCRYAYRNDKWLHLGSLVNDRSIVLLLLGSSGVLLVFFWVIEHQKNARRTPEDPEEPRRTPEEKPPAPPFFITDLAKLRDSYSRNAVQKFPLFPFFLLSFSPFLFPFVSPFFPIFFLCVFHFPSCFQFSKIFRRSQFFFILPLPTYKSPFRNLNPIQEGKKIKGGKRVPSPGPLLPRL